MSEGRRLDPNPWWEDLSDEDKFYEGDRRNGSSLLPVVEYTRVGEEVSLILALPSPQTMGTTMTKTLVFHPFCPSNNASVWRVEVGFSRGKGEEGASPSSPLTACFWLELKREDSLDCLAWASYRFLPGSVLFPTAWVSPEAQGALLDQVNHQGWNLNGQPRWAVIGPGIEGTRLGRKKYVDLHLHPVPVEQNDGRLVQMELRVALTFYFEVKRRGCLGVRSFSSADLVRVPWPISKVPHPPDWRERLTWDAPSSPNKVITTRLMGKTLDWTPSHLPRMLALTLSPDSPRMRGQEMGCVVRDLHSFTVECNDDGEVDGGGTYTTAWLIRYYMTFHDKPGSKTFLVQIHLVRDTSWFDSCDGLFPGEVYVRAELGEDSRPFPASWVGAPLARELIESHGRVREGLTVLGRREYPDLTWAFTVPLPAYPALRERDPQEGVPLLETLLRTSLSFKFHFKLHPKGSGISRQELSPSISTAQGPLSLDQGRAKLEDLKEGMSPGDFDDLITEYLLRMNLADDLVATAEKEVGDSGILEQMTQELLLGETPSSQSQSLPPLHSSSSKPPPNNPTCDLNKQDNRGQRSKERVVKGRVSKRKAQRVTCAVCQKSLSSTHVLRLHFKNIHDPKARIHVCPIPRCGEAFAQPRHLRSHLEQVHERKREALCPVQSCGARYYSAAMVRRHFGKKHSTSSVVLSECPDERGVVQTRGSN